MMVKMLLSILVVLSLAAVAPAEDAAQVPLADAAQPTAGNLAAEQSAEDAGDVAVEPGHVADAHSKPVVASIGDSWAAFASHVLQQVFDSHLESLGVKLLNHGIPGSTASEWGANTSGLVAAALGADYVWLSIGGNDVLGYFAHGDQAEWIADVERDTRTMLAALSALPELEVVIFGYDLVNFLHTPLCIAEAVDIFHNQSTQPQINQIFLELGALLEKVALDYPRVTYVSLWGTLQSQPDSGVPAPYPNPLYPSPAKYMGKDDCIHCNDEGWRILMEQLYHKYFKGKFASAWRGRRN